MIERSPVSNRGVDLAEGEANVAEVVVASWEGNIVVGKNIGQLAHEDLVVGQEGLIYVVSELEDSIEGGDVKVGGVANPVNSASELAGKCS